MNKILIAVLVLLAANASAQTEDGDKLLPDVKTDSLRLEKPDILPPLPTPDARMLLLYSSSSKPMSPNYVPTMDMSVSPYKIPGQFRLWKGAGLSVAGSQAALPGLMGINSGSITFRQDYGRLHFKALGMANKYWMPSMTVGIPTLQTQYGFGGTISYDVSKMLTLHAFGMYYATNPLVGAAVSPYVSTTQFGGYADIRMHKNFGVDTGVRRYLNPMTGQWVTDPIVSPYIRFNNGQKLGIQIGHLLKRLIWGNQDHYMPLGPVRMGPPPVRQ